MMPRLNLGLPYSKCEHPRRLTFTGLQRCSGCGIALYCGKEHQKEDWPRHKTPCTPQKSAKRPSRERKPCSDLTKATLTARQIRLRTPRP